MLPKWSLLVLSSGHEFVYRSSESLQDVVVEVGNDGNRMGTRCEDNRAGMSLKLKSCRALQIDFIGEHPHVTTDFPNDIITKSSQTSAKG